MKKLIVIFIVNLIAMQANCQLIGKSREQILKINYSKGRELVTMASTYVMFKEEETNYAYYFADGSDSCFKQALIKPLSKLSETVKDFTEKYKPVGPMSWVDKADKYMYTIITETPDLPSDKKYLVVSIEDYSDVLLRIFMQEHKDEIKDQLEKDNSSVLQDNVKRKLLKELNGGTPK